jgi:flagellar motor switch protein FliG
MNQKNAENGVFINGKKQVIELLKQMNYAEKSRLLKNLKLRNPSLAKELAESCISFESIFDLNDESLKKVISQIRPTIIGLALNLVSVKNQRRILSLIPRSNAIQAFEIMQKDLSRNRNECLRAQNKILEIALNLQKDRIIQFY